MIPPSNDEVPFIHLFFDVGDPEFEPPFILTSVCNEIIASGDVFSDVIIFFGIDPLPLIDCQLQKNIDFDALYFNFLGSATEFPYQLIEVGDILELIFTAPNGDQAIYGNEVLSLQDLKTVSFQVYPNPVKDFLYINAPGVSIQEIGVYTSLGKEVKKGSLQGAIDIRGLSKGIYFVVITSDQGTTVKKIIIE